MVADSHADRGADEWSFVVIRHRPADHRFRVAIDHGSEEYPTLPGRNVRDIADHLLARRRRGEVPPHQIRDRSGRRILVGQAVPPGPRLAGHQAQLAHQGTDQLQGAGVAAAPQRGVDPPVAVRLVRQLENHRDQLFQFLPACRGRRLRPAPPLVIAGTGNPQPLAHLHDGVLGPATRPEGAFLRVDELVPRFYRYSLAKKAAAFPRNSRSSLSSRFSFSNSRSRARSAIVSGGSSPACACRYAFTQLRKVCSFTPISRAVDGIARDSSTTIRAIWSLYSGVYDLRCLAITIPLFLPQEKDLSWFSLRKIQGGSGGAVVVRVSWWWSG